MKFNKIEKLFQNNFDKRDKFKRIADYIVEAHTKGLTDERKIDVSADTALGMAMGEAMAKNKYLSIGLGVGIVGTVITTKVIEKIKRRNTEEGIEEILEEQPIVYDMEKMEVVDENSTEEDEELTDTLDEEFDILEAIQPIKGTSDDIEELKSVLEEIEKHERRRK